jgi:myo-inositol 2-dehydrogenase/D-chiro-inositol 1-dehydrogenase
MKIAILGSGRMGIIRAEVLSRAGVDLTIFNRTIEKVRPLAEQLDCAYSDFSKLTNEEFDGYVVSTSTKSHLDFLNQLIPLGKPILCEKPISLNVEETDQVIADCKKYGTEIQVGFQRRFDPAMRSAEKMVRDGKVGTLYAMHLYAHDHLPANPEFLEGSGSIFKDLHVHDFDIVRWITGEEIVKVYATHAVREHQQYAKFDDADVSLVSLTTSNGVQVAITGTRHDPVGQDVRFEIFGSKDSLAVGLNAKTPLHAIDSDLTFSDQPYKGFIERFQEAFEIETQQFHKFVTGEIENPCPPFAARQALRVAIACEESIRSGNSVSIPL